MAAGRSLSLTVLGASSFITRSSVAPLCWRRLQAALSLCFVHRCALGFNASTALVLHRYDRAPGGQYVIRRLVVQLVHAGAFAADKGWSMKLVRVLLVPCGGSDGCLYLESSFRKFPLLASVLQPARFQSSQARLGLNLKSARRGTARTGQ